MLKSSLNRVVFAFDFETVASVGGVKYLLDRGPNGFHFAFPGGAANPTETLDGGYYFDNGDYLSLPVASMPRFYAAMPTGEHTWIFAFRASSLSIDAVFSCHGVTGGNSFGLMLLLLTNRMVTYQMQGGVPQPYAQTAAGSYGSAGPKYNGVLSVAATPVGSRNGLQDPLAWVAGAFGVTAFDTTFVPTIGKYATAASNYLHGTMYYLALVRGAVDLPTQLEIQQYLSVGRKPWAERGL